VIETDIDSTDLPATDASRASVADHWRVSPRKLRGRCCDCSHGHMHQAKYTI
jgi:hypothetical protein